MARELSDEEVAYHEAGHAVMSAILRRSFGTTTIDSEGGRVGGPHRWSRRQTYIQQGDHYIPNTLRPKTADLKRDLLVFVAGGAAEAIFRKSARIPLRYPDLKAVRHLASEIAARLSKDPEDLIQAACRDAQLSLAAEWLAVRAVAAYLVKHQSMSSRKVRETLRAYGG